MGQQRSPRRGSWKRRRKPRIYVVTPFCYRYSHPVVFLRMERSRISYQLFRETLFPLGQCSQTQIYLRKGHPRRYTANWKFTTWSPVAATPRNTSSLFWSQACCKATHWTARYQCCQFSFPVSFPPASSSPFLPSIISSPYHIKHTTHQFQTGIRRTECFIAQCNHWPIINRCQQLCVEKDSEAVSRLMWKMYGNWK